MRFRGFLFCVLLNFLFHHITIGQTTPYSNPLKTGHTKIGSLCPGCLSSGNSFDCYYPDENDNITLTFHLISNQPNFPKFNLKLWESYEYENILVDVYISTEGQSNEINVEGFDDCSYYELVFEIELNISNLCSENQSEFLLEGAFYSIDGSYLTTANEDFFNPECYDGHEMIMIQENGTYHEELYEREELNNSFEENYLNFIEENNLTESESPSLLETSLIKVCCDETNSRSKKNKNTLLSHQTISNYISPNPFNNFIEVKIIGESTYKFFDLNMQDVTNKTAKSDNIIDTSHLTSGFYYLIIIENGVKSIIKLTKI